MLRRRDDAISCFAGEVWGCSYPRRAGLLLRHAGRVGVGHSSSLMSFISAQEFQAQEPACSPAFRFICGLLIIHILPPACRYANGRGATTLAFLQPVAGSKVSFEASIVLHR